jgi:hypothetical protein
MSKTLLAVSLALAIAGASSANAADTFYAGVNTGGVVTNGVNKDTPWTVGAIAGMNVFAVGSAKAAVEGSFDYDKNESKVLMANIVPNFTIGNMTPYALAGIGYSWAPTGDQSKYNVGLGVKYAVTSNIDVDARYRRINNFNNNMADDRVTLGLNFKF